MNSYDSKYMLLKEQKMIKKEINEIPEKFKGKSLEKELLEIIPIELIREFRAFVIKKQEKEIHDYLKMSYVSFLHLCKKHIF